MFPLQDTIPSRRIPFMNISIIILNTLVFLYELKLSPHEIELFFRVFGLVPEKFTYYKDLLSWGDYYPFLTNMFLHGGWAHFIGNMWTLWIFGDNVEDRMGHGRYLLFYVLCGVAASYTHYLVNMYSPVPALGASGAISGVMGAYMFLFPHSRIVFLVPLFFIPYFFEIPAFVYLLFWFLGQLASGTLSIFADSMGGGIAFWAHIGGFAAGVALYRLFVNNRFHRYCRECDDSPEAYYYRYRNYY